MHLCNTTTGLYTTEEGIKANSYSAQEIFTNWTLSYIRNESLILKESYSLIFGTCYTLCFRKPVGSRNATFIRVKLNLKLQVLVHSEGEEEMIMAK
jgi:hypothetical protein